MTIPEQTEKLLHKLERELELHGQVCINKDYTIASPEVQDMPMFSLRLTVGEIRTIVAALPLMGVQRPERETIARTLYKSRGQFDDATVKLHFGWFLEQQGLPLPLRENPEARTAIVHSYRDADAILALFPVSVQRPEDVARALKDTLKVTSEHDHRPWSQIEAAALALPHTGQPQEGRAEITKWRDDAFEKSAQIVERYLSPYEAKYIVADIRALSASPPPPVAESGWQEIETAPTSPIFAKPPNTVDVWVEHSEWGGHREADAFTDADGEWCDRGGNKLTWTAGEDDDTITTSRVTHWMPRPFPPIVADQRPEVK